MITPISSNLNTKTNLEPVKVPHFCGLTSVTKSSKKDTFSSFKTRKVSNDPKKLCRTFFRGAKKGVGFIKKSTHKAINFLGCFFSSLLDDSKSIAKEKAAKTLTNVSDLI